MQTLIIIKENSLNSNKDYFLININVDINNFFRDFWNDYFGIF